MTYYEANNTIYLFGGISNDNGAVSNVYKWNVSDNDGWFRLIGNTATSRFFSATNSVVTIDEFAYFVGINVTKIYVFDMLHDSWIDANIPIPAYSVHSGCLSTNNTHIFLAGGTGGSGYSNYLQILDINTKTWVSEEITLPPINGGFAWNYCAMVEDTYSLYIMGGFDPIQHRTDDIYKYNTITSEWTYIGDKSVRSDAGIAVYVSQYQSIYIVGGWNGTQYQSADISIYDNIDIFDINSEDIRSTEHMIDGVYAAGVLAIDDSLYIFGGQDHHNPNNMVSSVQVCDLSLYPTNAPTINVPTENVILEISIHDSNISVNDIIDIVINSYPLIVDYEYTLTSTEIGIKVLYSA